MLRRFVELVHMFCQTVLDSLAGLQLPMGTLQPRTLQLPTGLEQRYRGSACNASQ